MSNHKTLPLIEYPQILKDDFGTPTEQALEYLLNWGHKIIDDQVYFGQNYGTVAKYDDLINYLSELWVYKDYVVYDGFELELHTGGVSSNETIIDHLKNTCLWSVHWYKSVVGGHYYFKINKKKSNTIEIIKITNWNNDREFYIKWNNKIIKESKSFELEEIKLKYEIMKKTNGKLETEEVVEKEEIE